MQNIFTNIKCSEIICPMLMKTSILHLTTCFHGFAILRHVDPFVRMLHIYGIIYQVPYKLMFLTRLLNV